MNAKRRGANRPEERADMAEIVFGVDMNAQLRSKIEADIKMALATLGVPIADPNGQINLLTGNTDRSIQEFRVPAEHAKRVRDALTDALETRGLRAITVGSKNKIEIIMAPAEEQRKAIGY
ncbi:MAG: hypothetical protein V1880_04105 [Patescibacteria group bacterium]